METGLSILRHSMDVLQRHPRLLWFLAIDLLLGYLAYRFFFGPVFEASAEGWRETEFPGGQWSGRGPGFPYLQMALVYLPGVLYATFINVALCSQILRALNGGQVSVREGFRVAVARLPAIMGWSLLAGTVGLVLRLLQERVGFLGRWVLGLTGLSWSVATVFVVPVIINEPGQLRARDYLRISGSLVRRVWGEGVASLVSLGFMGIVVGVALVALGLLVRVVTDSQLVAIYTVGLISALLAIAGTLLWRVFTCGLYVYATEGVAPDGFDEELMQRAWVVKSVSGAAVWPPAGTQPGVRGEVLPRKMVLGLLAAAGVMAGAVWLLIPELKPEQGAVQSHPFIGPQVGVVTIDLAALDYELQYAHLQQAGIFTGRSRIGCDFPPEPTPKLLHEQAEGLITATLLRQGRFLHISFYGEEGPTKQRMTMATEGLRAIFPERAGSIYPERSIPYLPRATVAEWQPVKGAISYVLEMDCYHCCGKNRWCADQGRAWKVERNLSGTRHTFEWVGSQPGRWRVWSIDADGRAGPKSGWTHFDWTVGTCGQQG